MSGKRLIVMKFGGTSVGSAERFRLCAEILRTAAEKDRIIVVVSAVAGVTDVILKTIEASRQGDAAMTDASLRKLELLHQALIAELFGDGHSHTVLSFVNQVLDQLRSSCRALLTLRSQISAETKDSLAALGERISAWVLANYLCQTGTSSEFVSAENVVVTDSNFGNAAPDMQATVERCQAVILPIVDRGAIPVVTGYCGANKAGQTTTLGRGGSDYSATIIGAAAAAHEVWIWTDVDGVLTADPRICPDAATLPEISFAEAIELAYYGAKVIHPKAAYPALDAGVAVWIKNSFQPHVGGTKITHSAAPFNSPVKAVTCVNHATLITLVTRRDVHSAELFGRLFLRLGQEQVDLLFATQSSPEHALGLVVRKEDTARVLHLIHNVFRIELAQGVVLPLAIQNDIAVIAVLGESMRGTCGILGRVFSAVAAQQVSVIAVAQGASELSICFAVASANAAEVVRAVHSEFCEGAEFAMGPASRPDLSLIAGV
ncbi:MAG TPA: aspartate kinase [Candidatus Dormibacteraeota bacterium]|jgi:aspartokinase/homoserine dehydrogenase 1|nr:aspartate kinase [Candidatus Dormibacteraeota bacterium]